MRPPKWLILLISFLRSLDRNARAKVSAFGVELDAGGILGILGVIAILLLLM